MNNGNGGKNGNGHPQRLALIASQGTLDWGYPPFILASTASALDMQAAVFFTFYGLLLLRKDLSDLRISPHANPAMPMKMPFGPKGFQKISWKMPNLVTGVIPGFNAMATSLMKRTFHNKGVAKLEELRTACLEGGVRLIGCQMTMDVFGFTKDDFIDGIELGGAATFLEFAAESNITLFV